jgi:8-oxo-dGTP diphosphatase
MPAASKIILTNKENKVLLQLRSKNHSHPGSWALFGGHIEDSETPEEALIREIKEEINYLITDYQLIKETVVEDFGKVFWFHGIIDAKLPELTLNEGDDFNFFTYEELSKIKIAPESKKILIEYFEDTNK